MGYILIVVILVIAFLSYKRKQKVKKVLNSNDAMGTVDPDRPKPKDERG